MKEIIDRLKENRQIEIAKSILESNGYDIQEEFVFEGLDDSDVVPLREFLESHGNENSWEETLEEALESDLSGDQIKEYRVGDIIMPNSIYSPSSSQNVDPHKILLIQSKHADNGIIHYKGFLLSSKVNNSNKYGKYPNNIYIADYATILHRGVPQHKEAFIRIDDIVEFTNEDLNTSGTWKGSATNKFLRFVNNCYNNYKHGISNKYRHWTGEHSYKDNRQGVI